MSIDYKMLTWATLSKQAYWTINKQLSKQYGIESALLLSDLLAKEKYFAEGGELQNDGSFFNEQTDIERDTTLSAYKQRNAINPLEKGGIITTELKGLPKRLYYKINHENLIKVLTYRGKEISPPEVKKFDTINKNKVNKVTKVTIMGKTFPLKELQIEYNSILSRTLINIGGFRTNINKNSKTMCSVYKYLKELEHNSFLKDKDFTESSKKGKMLFNMNTTRIESITGNKRKLENILKKAAREYKARRSDKKQFFIPDKNPSMADFFYNPEYNNSWFLHCCCCDPMIRSGYKQDSILKNLISSLETSEPNLKKLTNKIYNDSDSVIKDWDISEQVTFYSCVKNLIEWRNKNKEKLSEKNDGWRTHFGGTILMFSTIGHFLEDFFPRPNPRFLVPDGWNWKQFENYCLNSFDVNLKTRR